MIGVAGAGGEEGEGDRAGEVGGVGVLNEVAVVGVAVVFIDGDRVAEAIGDGCPAAAWRAESGVV